MMLIGAAAKEERVVRCSHVLARQLRKMPLYRHFAGVHRKAVNRTDRGAPPRHIDEEVIDRRCTDRGKHRLAIGLG